MRRVRGTEDKLDLHLYNFMLNQIKKHLERYNFNQIETPIIEHTDLFIRSVGQETDIVSKEMYVFQTASGESICLRPEGTASVIRAYVENSIEDAPWKVFIHGPMFRHERPQKGRWREFNQLSFEIINSKNIAQDAHVLKMLDVLFSETFKLDNYVLKINFLGSLDDRRKHRDALKKFLDDLEDKICSTCQIRKDKNTLRVFDCKNETCKNLYAKAPKVTDHLSETSGQEWQLLQEILSMLSVSYVVDSSLVRGLDYYNKTVFEFSSSDLGAQNAFCGGGRYSLGKDMGARADLPSIGAAIGMGRLLMLIENNLNKLLLPQKTPLHVIVPFTQDQVPLALLIADNLQAAGLTTDVILSAGSITKMMKKADKLGAKNALIIGPDEQAAQSVSVKNMQKGETTLIKQIDLAKFLR